MSGMNGLLTNVTTSTVAASLSLGNFANSMLGAVSSLAMGVSMLSNFGSAVQSGNILGAVVDLAIAAPMIAMGVQNIRQLFNALQEGKAIIQGLTGAIQLKTLAERFDIEVTTEMTALELQ